MRSALACGVPTALLALATTLLGCPAGGGGVPVAEVTPTTVDFGTIEVGDWEILEVTVRNAGTTQLNVTAAELFVDQDPSPYTAGGTEMALRPAESGTISVSFRPETPGTFTGSVVFTTNAPREPEFTIPLTGVAIASDLVLSSEGIDFGSRPEGCTESQVVTLTNTGEAALLGLDVTISGDDEGVELIGADDPIDIGPSESVDVTVQWTPVGDTALDAVFSVTEGNDELARIDVMGGGLAIVADQSASFTVPTVSEIDFLWVIDTGLTMDVVQTRVGNAAGELMAELEDQFYDWRFAVISADADLGGELLAPVIGPLTPDRTTAFGDAVSQATGSGTPGWGMEMAWNAITPPLIDSGQPNFGIRREGAGLAIVFVSTGVDQSTLYGGSGEAFRESFVDLVVQDPAMLTISVISGLDTGCTTNNVAASQTPEYLAASWRGQEQSICTNPLPLWPFTYSGPHQRSAWELDPPALGSSIEVTLTESGGTATPVTDGWNYDADRDWLVFEDGDLPPFDATLDVAWAPADICE